MPDIFSYTETWSCKKKGAQLYRHLRVSYFLKGLILIPFLPFDIAYLIFRRFFRGKAKPGYVFSSAKALDQCFEAISNKSSSLFLISDPLTAIKHKGRAIVYIPASPIYVVCAILPWRGRCRNTSNKIINKVTRYLLSQIFHPGRFVFVMHSDALPFARAILFATKNNPIVKSANVCIQHGIFHEHFECAELDGSLADINVTRSEFDMKLIEKNNKNSLFIISEEFFLPTISSRLKHIDAAVILVGEGFHVVDRKLSKKYISKLKVIEAELISRGWSVKYRPHPSEKLIYRSFGFKNIDSLDLKNSLASALAYIGYSSTLLVEASSIGIPCYALKIEGEASVKLHRNSCNSGIVDYQVSNFSPKANKLDTTVDADLMRLTAQKAVFSKIEEVLYG